MDDLTECCTRYKVKILEDKDESATSNLASLMELDQQKLSPDSPSLIQMGQNRESKSSMEDCSCR